MTDSKEQIHGTITARAELDRNFARLIIEDVTSVMSKNLVTILDMMERQHIDLRALLEDNSTRLGKLVDDVGALSLRLTALESRMDTSQEDRQSIHNEITALRKELRAYIAGNRRDEYERRLSALEARDDG